jgi:NAD(P)H-nitrite reductase large subunit
VVEVNRSRRIVRAADGTEAAYDRLLLATGSNPFILPLPGKELEGVIAYRDIADTETMIEAAKTHRHAVVVGGGLLGLEAANGLMRRGMSVTVVHIAPVADGAPARRGRRPDAAEVARGAGPALPDRRRDRGARRRRWPAG